MRALLTGATGFIGRYVLDELLARGDAVRVIVRPQSLEHSTDARALAERPRVELARGDLADGDVLREATRDVDVVYHFAWHSRRRDRELIDDDNGDTADDNADTATINLSAARALLDGTRTHGVRRFVFTSSIAVYGGGIRDQNEWPLTEEAPLGAGSFAGQYLREYVEPKIAIENMIRSSAHDGGFDYVILRPSIVYGPGGHWAETMLESAQRAPFGMRDPRPAPQLVHVRDLARACVQAGLRSEAGEREFNIAGDEMLTMGELTRLVQASLFRSQRGLPALRQLPRRVEREPRYDTSKARMFLGFRPRVSIAQGIAELVMEDSDSEGPESTLREQATQVGSVYDQRIESGVLD